MINTLMLPMTLWRRRGTLLALGALSGPTYLSAEAAATTPVLTGAIILAALVLFGTFVLTRWKMMMLTAPLWLMLMAQSGQSPLPLFEAQPQVAQTATLPPASETRPLARPWG